MSTAGAAETRRAGAVRPSAPDALAVIMRCRCKEGAVSTAGAAQSRRADAVRPSAPDAQAMVIRCRGKEGAE